MVITWMDEAMDELWYQEEVQRRREREAQFKKEEWELAQAYGDTLIVPSEAGSQEWVSDFFERVFDDEIMETRAAGQAEYAHDTDNAFANFERTAGELGLRREQVLWVFAMKHRDGIAAYLQGHTSQREDVTGRIKDLIVYLLLLWAMVEQDRTTGTSSSASRS